MRVTVDKCHSIQVTNSGKSNCLWAIEMTGWNGTIPLRSSALKSICTVQRWEGISPGEEASTKLLITLIISVPYYYNQISNRKRLWKEQVFFSIDCEGFSLWCWEAWWQEGEAACHIVSTAKKQREECNYLAFLLFIQPRTPAYGMELSTFRVGLLVSINLI